MSSLIIKSNSIIIRVKCDQAAVEFSIHFNQVSESSLPGSRLDAHQIFPNVLIIPRSQECHVIIRKVRHSLPHTCVNTSDRAPIGTVGNTNKGAAHMWRQDREEERRGEERMGLHKISLGWRLQSRAGKLCFLSFESRGCYIAMHRFRASSNQTDYPFGNLPPSGVYVICL